MLFDIEFVKKAKMSFRKIKVEMDSLKSTVNDWIQYLSHKDNELEQRIMILETRVRQLEQERELRV